MAWGYKNNGSAINQSIPATNRQPHLQEASHSSHKRGTEDLLIRPLSDVHTDAKRQSQLLGDAWGAEVNRRGETVPTLPLV